ncbi:uncharacterized protein LOC116166219 [Photinus pyralis]|uniref:uncharacterized protein LOC116166219 n=1 Tax=Photinus pyralis TaxID=7054 RepID=UPI001266F14E|nr:uncharacterized protein LOC116166219 [Photinus pyralis]
MNVNDNKLSKVVRGVNCNTCCLKIDRYDDSIDCVVCMNSFHILCVNITIDKLHEIKRSKEVRLWKCNSCLCSDSEDPDTSFTAQHPVAVTMSVTLEQVYSLILSIKSNQEDLAKSLNGCHQKIDDNTTLLREQQTKIEACFEKIGALESKNKKLRCENNELKSKLNNMEQYARSNSVEIRGVPELQGENILSVILQVGKSVGFSVNKNMIDACHRLAKNPNKPSEPRAIILKFISRLDKHEFMKCRKIKRHVTVQDLGELFAGVSNVNPNSLIYINESLTGENKVLFGKARTFAKQDNIKYVWTRDGKLLMRKSDNTKVFVIRSINDFKDVH